MQDLWTQVDDWEEIHFGDSALIGDNIELYGVDDLHWFILGQCTNSVGIGSQSIKLRRNISLQNKFINNISMYKYW